MSGTVATAASAALLANYGAALDPDSELREIPWRYMEIPLRTSLLVSQTVSLCALLCEVWTNSPAAAAFRPKILLCESQQNMTAKSLKSRLVDTCTVVS